MKTVAGVLSIMFLLVCVSSAIIFGITSWRIYQDVDGWKDRAEVSSEPHDMLLYMTNVKNGMEKWGMTTGNSALIWQSPASDMGLIYRNIGQYVDQAEILTNMDRSSTQYAMNLEQLSWSINRLELHSSDYWGTHQGLPISVAFYVGLALFLVFGFTWLMTY